MSIVMRGSYLERVGNTRLECLPLQLRLHPAGEEHAHDVGMAGAHCLLIELPDDWGESIDGLIARARGPVLVETAGWMALEAAAAHQRHDRVVHLEPLAADLLNLCEDRVRLHSAAESSAAVRRATAMIEDCIDQPLTISALAAEARLHPTHFARSFRATTGYTVGHYIRRRRVARAQALFMNAPWLGLARVAAETGFADHAHLTRTFRQVVGVAPSVYRAALRREGVLPD
jgi:AraC family transcriptional regulator